MCTCSRRRTRGASEGLQREAFSCTAPLFLPSSVIIHSRVLLYAVAFTEVLHCASVYELMTSRPPSTDRRGQDGQSWRTARPKRPNVGGDRLFNSCRSISLHLCCVSIKGAGLSALALILDAVCPPPPPPGPFIHQETTGQNIPESNAKHP